MIRHTIVFTLNHSKGSVTEAEFFKKVVKLEHINVVQKFEVLQQLSKTNPFDYGLSMEFASKTEYQYFKEHPDYLDFWQEVWKKEVHEFMEIDYKVVDPFALA
ncbi:Dabb family protein [Catenovulum sp. 2E275]|uniref:Dabb family protein n=1 Tax=Catenovulum sp. 2E275 TaxID=2980497 RepID=UPI0021D23787|nr:Dabb family protein [Catenovulum sp. 2E275]MCU4676345.1 Dabb family protein [Catenovulum sp. 2E275]